MDYAAALDLKEEVLTKMMKYESVNGRKTRTKVGTVKFQYEFVTGDKAEVEVDVWQ